MQEGEPLGTIYIFLAVMVVGNQPTYYTSRNNYLMKIFLGHKERQMFVRELFSKNLLLWKCSMKMFFLLMMCKNGKRTHNYNFLRVTGDGYTYDNRSKRRGGKKTIWSLLELNEKKKWPIISG